MSSTSSTATGCRGAQSIIPDPYDTYEERLRFAHLDLEKLNAEEVWAHLRIVEDDLAKRIYTEGNRHRGAADRAWLRERARRLRERAHQLDTEDRRRRRP